MNDLVAKIIAAVTAATTGELFDDAGTDAGTTEPTVYDSFIKKNEPGHNPKKEHPFVLVRPVAGEDSPGKSDIFVPIQAGIHTHGNTNDGAVDIRRMSELLLHGFGDAEQFYPFSLDKIITTLGYPQDGDQPHPKYYANLELTFSRQPILNNLR